MKTTELRSPGPRVSGFRDDQKRRRRLLHTGAVVAWIFGVFMTQVWMSTEVKERQARVSQLDVTLGRLEVDLSALEGRLQKEQTFSELLMATAELGLSSDGVRQRVALPPSEAGYAEIAKTEHAQASIVPSIHAPRRSSSRPSMIPGHGKGR